MPAPDYEISAGTVMGEVRNEIFNKHGLLAYESAKYGWHHENPSTTQMKMYNLVSGSSVEFLVAKITYPLIETIIPPPDTSSYMEEISGSMVLITSSLDPAFATSSVSYSVDRSSPSELEFLWYDANIPFLDKDIIDAQNIKYELK